jgi:Xaa-Pro aminopeptidase
MELDNPEDRITELQQRMANDHIDVILIDDAESIYYFAEYWDYLGMEFGRPTLLVIPRTGDPTLITPGLEAEMAGTMSWITDIREWTDGEGEEWRGHLQSFTAGRGKWTIGMEVLKTHPMVSGYINRTRGQSAVKDIAAMLSEMRMVKTPAEIQRMRQAGQVAIAMCDAAAAIIGVGVPEYELALAGLTAGTRKAAEFLTDSSRDAFFSPLIHNLQVLQSGKDLSMVHRRPTRRRLQKGDPVYMCFCPFNLFKQIKLGFDREYFVGSVSDEHAKIYDTALQAQAAALSRIRPGVIAEEVHFASLEIYRNAGFGICYRTGRGVGFSHLERPEFIAGDKTPLKAGMTFAVDGGITIPGEYGARVGDSIVVTDEGFDYLTPYPKELRIL